MHVFFASLPPFIWHSSAFAAVWSSTPLPLFLSHTGCRRPMLRTLWPHLNAGILLLPPLPIPAGLLPCFYTPIMTPHIATWDKIWEIIWACLDSCVPIDDLYLRILLPAAQFHQNWLRYFLRKLPPQVLFLVEKGSCWTCCHEERLHKEHAYFLYFNWAPNFSIPYGTWCRIYHWPFKCIHSPSNLKIMLIWSGTCKGSDLIPIPDCPASSGLCNRNTFL